MKPQVKNNGTISLTMGITFEIPGSRQSLTMTPNPTVWIRLKVIFDLQGYLKGNIKALKPTVFDLEVAQKT